MYELVYVDVDFDARVTLIGRVYGFLPNFRASGC